MSHLPITDTSDVDLANPSEFEVPTFIKRMTHRVLIMPWLKQMGKIKYTAYLQL